MQPPDPIETDRLKSPQAAVSSPPRGTIAPIIFRGLLAAGMTLWVAFVLCELAPVVGDIWRGLKAWEFFKYIPFVQQTGMEISLVVLPLILICYTGDFSDHPDLWKRARLLFKLFVFLVGLHLFLLGGVGHF